MDGFFPSSSYTSRNPLPLVARCGKCGLFRSCQSPKIPLDGDGRKSILIVGEAPGKTEDARGRPFVGDSGQYLRSVARDFDIDLNRDCWIYNSLICRLPDNAKPTDQQIDWCRPNVLRVIRECNPKVIILLGGSAVRSVIGHLWKEDVGPLTRWVGWKIPCQDLNAWVCPTYHPSHCLRSKDDPNGKIIENTFRKHLEAAFTEKQRPWRDKPDYEKQVSVLFTDVEAETWIDGFCSLDHPVAVDYETEGLKPDRSDLQIVSCALSDGTTTVSYPWYGRAIAATRRFLRSPTPKVASNLKMEERWSIAKADTPVRNWHWDTVIAAHTLDNRTGTAGLKFQSFVLLGQASYDDDIKPYLKAPDANTRNRIRQVDLRQLLTYGGMDALLEIEVMKKQKDMMGLTRKE